MMSATILFIFLIFQSITNEHDLSFGGVLETDNPRSSMRYRETVTSRRSRISSLGGAGLGVAGMKISGDFTQF